MWNIFGDKGIGRQWHLQEADIPATGGRHDRDILVAQRLDGRLEQSAQVRVVDGALRDVDDGAVQIELRPPRGWPEIPGRGGMDGAHVSHGVRQIASWIVELGDRRCDQPVAQHADIEDEARQRGSVQPIQLLVGGALRLAQQHPLGQRVEGAIAQPAEPGG